MNKKNANIKNINTIGLIMRILLIIGRVLTIIAFIVVAGLSIFTIWAPVDDVKIRPAVHMEVEYDEASDGEKLIEGSKKSDWDLGDMSVKWYLKEKEVSGGRDAFTVDGEISEITGTQIKGFILKKLIIAAVYLAALFVALLFGGKLAKALEKCETPFADDVIKKLVNFGKSLIPLGVLSLLLGSFGTGMTALILLLFLFVNLFKYGAELQKDVDETV